MDALTASLALLRLEGLGPASYWQLVERFGSAAAALEQLPDTFSSRFTDRARLQLQEFRRSGKHSALGQWALGQRQRCAEQCIYLLHSDDDNYPALLKQIHRPPPVLYVAGDLAALALPQIAIVGARRATRAGLDNAEAFARDLAAAGFGISSGLALGVDAAAHRGALLAEGKTVAVLGTGVDRFYPQRNTALAEQILAADGAIISEMPLGAGPEPGNFPRRNRIISGLSLGVLLVEAAVKSGSLITARLALEQNREVFAIPGSIHNPLARGCHRMIREGATLVETSADIAEQLSAMLAGYVRPAASSVATVQAEKQPDSLAPALQKLVRALGGDPRSIEQLARDTGDDTGALMANLLQLELEGLVEQLPGGYQLTAGGAKTLTALAE